MKPLSRLLALSLVLIVTLPVVAQESESYRLAEHVFNAGGNPSNGAVLISAGYRITLDAIGDSVAARNLTSNSYEMEGGFVPAYPPPAEVLGVSFTDPVTLTWDPERSVGDYNLYRDLTSSLPGLDYGTCEQQEIPESTTSVDDTAGLMPGQAYFYLVTAENRLGEEGTKGKHFDGTEREGSVCP